MFNIEKYMKTYKYMIGKKYDKLTVLEYSHRVKKKYQYHYYWKCICDCGKELTVEGRYLRNNMVGSCGCSRYKNLIGEKFNRLTVIELSHSIEGKRMNHYYWKCKCDCGNETVVRGEFLRDNAVKSCGCLIKENTFIGDKSRTHGMCGTKIYKSWQKMKERCLNPNYKEKRYYSEKGITVCEEWLEFENFYKWALENGYKEGLTIDRIDNSKNYEPNNCRWTDNKGQQNNKTTTIRLTYNGKTQTISEWSEELGIDRKLIHLRYRRKMPIEKILYKGNLRYSNTEIT